MQESETPTHEIKDQLLQLKTSAAEKEASDLAFSLRST